MTYILVDIGGTKTRIAASSDLEKFDEPVILDTPQEYDRGLELIVKTAQSIGQGEIQHIAVGMKRPGSRSLADWKGKPFKKDLTALLQAPVEVENDVAICGLGEALYGAGKGVSICVYITVSTGVNGVRVVDGRIDRSWQGFETGAQYLGTDGKTTLESIISGKSIQARFGKHPKELGKDNPVWEELARVLAHGVHNTIGHWSPERIVIGGSMMNEIGISVPRVAAHAAALNIKYDVMPEIVHSSLGDVGGLWGGLALLKQLG